MVIQGVDVSNVMTYLLNELSCTMEYNWNPDFCQKDLQEYYNRAQKEMSKIDFTKLTIEQLEFLGFRKFSQDSDFYCVPIWLFNCLPNGLELICITGKKYVKGKDYIDLDTRSGLLAFGFKPYENVLK